MVDVGDKSVTHRQAIASGIILMRPETLAIIQSGDNYKGDVLGVSRLAGIMAAKQTSQLIPLCHPLSLSAISIDFEIIDNTKTAIKAIATVKTDGKTGVEMEALTAVNIALLTIYDMAKAVDKGMVMGDIQLEEKRGGKSGNWHRTERAGKEKTNYNN